MCGVCRPWQMTGIDVERALRITSKRLSLSFGGTRALPGSFAPGDVGNDVVDVLAVEFDDGRGHYRHQFRIAAIMAGGG